MADRPANTSADALFFKPGILRSKKRSEPLREFTLDNASNNATSLTGSFRYDPAGSPLKSTQQLNVDFADFSQHTFFNSAEAKTQKAFSKIVNSYPFDGSRSEINTFVDDLTGFEKYVFDSFPTNSGYLAFSGSASPTDPGTYIQVNDFKGSTNPTLAKDATGQSVIDPDTKPFSIEFHFSAPGIANDNQVILQKLSSNNGFTLFLSESASTTSADLYMILASAGTSITASMPVTKGQFNHVAAVYDKVSGPGGQIKLYKNAALTASSSFAQMGTIDFKTAPLYIGSGSSHAIDGYNAVPVETLSGALDDLRFWHSARTQDQIEQYRYQEIFAQSSLQMLMRFNEPSGSFSGNGSNLVLDYSGNSLHSSIQNFSMALRNTSSFGSSQVTEASNLSTIALFPSFTPLTTLNANLLTSASQYDAGNPNIVTRLIPSHYLRDASQFEGFEAENGSLSDEIATQTDQPGGAVLGQPQIIAGLLYTMAENFDELKMFVDEFKRLLKVDYLTTDTVSNQLMPWLSRYYGIYMPALFDKASPEQYLDGKNVRLDRIKTTALQTVQNAIWRRIFSDLPYLFSTRGTLASLYAILNNVGITPNGPVRIRELGGSSVRTLGDSYVRRHEIAAMLDMSGTLGPAGTLDAQGIDDSRPFLQSSYLSGSRTEPGYPEIGPAPANNGVFTSGSWSVEGTYKFERDIEHSQYQSLSRMHGTGSSEHSVFINCVAKKPQVLGSVTGSVTLYARPAFSIPPGVPLLELALTGVDIFDGGKWQVTYGRNRNDSIESVASSSYFLRASKFTPGGLEQYYTTSSFYYAEGPGVGSNSLEGVSASANASGSFIVIGSQSLPPGAFYLNDVSLDSLTKETNFSGKVSGLRFYSKGLTEKESKTHARNFKSLGVEDPEVNFNFVTNLSGSFERLRYDVSWDQVVTQSDSGGAVTGFDFSQNGLTFAGTGFEASKRIIKPERFDFDVLSSNFQSGENPNKIRIRSFQNSEDVETFGTAFAPLYRLPQNEEPKDDRRVTIEVSVMQGLNEDIMNIFGTLDYLDNVIGSPELVFSQDYPHMRNLRRIYFNRLTQKVNFTAFFDFFKFLDDTIGILLEQMLPSDAKLTGPSYVLESNALERPKFTYKYFDLYLGEEDRGDKDVYLLTLIEGSMKKI
jgi:hypothetical protein